MREIRIKNGTAFIDSIALPCTDDVVASNSTEDENATFAALKTSDGYCVVVKIMHDGTIQWSTEDKPVPFGQPVHLGQ